MKLKRPKTLEEAWEIIQAQVCQIEELQQQVKRLQEENEKLKNNQSSKRPPSFVKENTKKEEKKKRGPRFGHGFFGWFRSQRVDEEKEWFLERCPDCGGKVSEAVESMERQEVDIPPVEPVLRRHIIGRHWCRHCRKIVSHSVPGLLPHTPFSQSIHLRVAHLKFGLGLTLEKIQMLLKEVYGLKISSGALSEMLSRLGCKMDLVHAWLQEEARGQEVLHADETGWRVDGINHWLWSFSSATMVYYHIDRSRGQKVVSMTLGETFAGVLVSDFFNAYALIAASKQKCLVHLLRQLEKMQEDHSKDRQVALFAKKIKGRIQSAFKLKAKQNDLEEPLFQKRVQRIKNAFFNAVRATSPHPVIRKFSTKLLKYRRELFVFLDRQDVPYHNNDAERQIRPCVLMRKISYQNASQQGAKTQAILMSVLQTCRKRKMDFFTWGQKYLAITGPPKDPFVLV